MCINCIELPGCQIDAVEVVDNQLIIEAHTVGRSKRCPNCRSLSTDVHSYYVRKPQDLPISEYQASLRLRVRRFRCHNAECQQKTFTEQQPELLLPHARRTQRLTEIYYHCAQALGGEAGARLLRQMRMPTSGDTLLRVLKQCSVLVNPLPCIIGVDDWAFRKGHHYGTIITDLEQHTAIDLLPDRTSSTLAAWLKCHPSVKVVARDRSPEYAKGIDEGAPTAIQVADRWHLLKNLVEVLERQLNQMRGVLLQLPEVSSSIAVNQDFPAQRACFPHTTNDQVAKDSSRQRRLKRYQTIQQLRSKGYSIRRIAKHLGLHRETVRKCYYAAAFPERAPKAYVPSILDPYLPYLTSRLQDGCENARQLWREIQTQGYPGQYCQVSKWVRQHRTQPSPHTAKKHWTQPPVQSQSSAAPLLPSGRRLAWLIVRDEETLTAREKENLARIRQNQLVEAIIHLAKQFRLIVQERLTSELDRWLDACLQCPASVFQNFAQGIKQDYAAVRAALELPWSSGQSEGQINRLKLLKRQMYGRASFDLLRLRVLYKPP